MRIFRENRKWAVFFSSVIMEPGPFKPFKMTLKLGAPNLVIPSDTTSKQSYMVVSLGELNCITHTEEDAVRVFQEYKIDITDLQSYIVWEWHNVKDSTRDDKDYLFQPLRIHTSLKST